MTFNRYSPTLRLMNRSSKLHQRLWWNQTHPLTSHGRKLKFIPRHPWPRKFPCIVAFKTKRWKLPEEDALLQLTLQSPGASVLRGVEDEEEEEEEITQQMLVICDTVRRSRSLCQLRIKTSSNTNHLALGQSPDTFISAIRSLKYREREREDELQPGKAAICFCLTFTWILFTLRAEDFYFIILRFCVTKIWNIRK